MTREERVAPRPQILTGTRFILGGVNLNVLYKELPTFQITSLKTIKIAAFL